jgi:hypothetical protein
MINERQNVDSFINANDVCAHKHRNRPDTSGKLSLVMI